MKAPTLRNKLAKLALCACLMTTSTTLFAQSYYDSVNRGNQSTNQQNAQPSKQQNDPVVQSIAQALAVLIMKVDQILENNKHFHAATGTANAGQYYENNPNVGYDIVAHQTDLAAKQASQQVANKNNNSDLTNTFGNSTSKQNEAVENYGNKVAGSDFDPAQGDHAALNQKVTTDNANFDSTSLMSPLAYNKNQADAADNFIKYSSNTAIPYVYLSNTAINNLADSHVQNAVENSYYLKQYRVSTRQYAAALSTPLAYLNHLKAERTLIPGVAKQAGIKQDDPAVKQYFPNYGNDGTASHAELDNYLATKNLNDPNWYKQIETMSNTSLLRQIAYSLEIMKYQNYQAHQDREYANLLSAMSLARDVSGDKDMLDGDRETLEDFIQDLKDGKPTPFDDE